MSELATELKREVFENVGFKLGHGLPSVASCILRYVTVRTRMAGLFVFSPQKESVIRWLSCSHGPFITCGKMFRILVMSGSPTWTDIPSNWLSTHTTFMWKLVYVDRSPLTSYAFIFIYFSTVVLNIIFWRPPSILKSSTSNVILGNTFIWLCWNN